VAFVLLQTPARTIAPRRALRPANDGLALTRYSCSSKRSRHGYTRGGFVCLHFFATFATGEGGLIYIMEFSSVTATQKAGSIEAIQPQ
jgi:hypothetical protein